MQMNQAPNYGITPQTRPEADYNAGNRSSRLTGRQGSSAQRPVMLSDENGRDQGELEEKPKIVKDFAKAYMQVSIRWLADLWVTGCNVQMVEDMASKAAQGDGESQLLVTEEEMKEL